MTNETAPNPSTAFARVLLGALAEAGVRHVVLSPGSRSTALALAAHHHPQLQLHVQIDERSAAFVALGIGRATGQPAAVVTTSGSAVANLHPAVIEADQDGVPLILLTADRPESLRRTGANQTINQHKLFGSAVRWFHEPPTPAETMGVVATWWEMAERAVDAATAGVRGPGPVHLNLPFAEPTIEASDDGRSVAAPFMLPLGRPESIPIAEPATVTSARSDSELPRIAAALVNARRGVVVAGHGATSAGSAGVLAQALGWPLIAEPSSGERHGPNIVAHATDITLAAAMPAPDLVVRVGRLTVSASVGRWLEKSSATISFLPPAAWYDAQRLKGEVHVVDVEDCLSELSSLVEDARATGSDSDWLSAWALADSRAGAAIDRALRVDAVTEPGAIRAVFDALHPGTNLVVGSSGPIRDFDRFAAARADINVYANRGASGIDGVVSTAEGIAIGSGRATYCILGDVSFLHDLNAWLLSPDAEAAMNITVVVIDNNGGGIFHFLPQAGSDGFDRLWGTPHNLDLRHAADLHGLEYQRVQSQADLAIAISDGQVGRPRLLHVVTTRAENTTLHRDIREAVGAALNDQ